MQPQAHLLNLQNKKYLPFLQKPRRRTTLTSFLSHRREDQFGDPATSNSGDLSDENIRHHGVKNLPQGNGQPLFYNHQEDF